MNVNEKYSKILHVKIPKNGTHSINKVLDYKDNWNRNYFFGHDPLYVLEKNNQITEDVFIFCVSRNPFSRFYSQYKQLVKTQKNYEDKNIFDFIDDIKNCKIHPFFTAKQVEWVSIKKENILPEKMSGEEKNYYQNVNFKNQYENMEINTRINKIYKIENIKEFEDDFQIRLPYMNWSNYSINQYKKCIDKKVQKFIIRQYEQDFFNFCYSLNFEDSIFELTRQRKKLLFYQ